jgi:plastocyanin
MRIGHIASITAAAALVAAVALSTAAVAGGGEARKSKARASVSVRDDFFSPRRARVDRGGTVTWRWRGDAEHNVRFRQVPRGAKRPKGSRLQTEGRFARTFRGKRGLYRYVCTIHEDLGMRGSVEVE